MFHTPADGIHHVELFDPQLLACDEVSNYRPRHFIFAANGLHKVSYSHALAACRISGSSLCLWIIGQLPNLCDGHTLPAHGFLGLVAQAAVPCFR